MTNKPTAAEVLEEWRLQDGLSDGRVISIDVLFGDKITEALTLLDKVEKGAVLCINDNRI